MSDETPGAKRRKHNRAPEPVRGNPTESRLQKWA